MSAVRVLLLEDSPAYSELVQAQLADTLPEADVDAAATLAEALGHLDGSEYDAVLADLSLPDAEGLDVVRRLHAHRRDTALVVLTGRADGALALEALAEGAQEYLVKGADDGARLATVIRHTVQRTRAEHDARRYERLASSLLDALEAPTCAVDRTSRIVAVNAAWNAFAVEGGVEPAAVGVGASYLEVCDAVPAGSPDAETAQQVAAGLRDVLAGTRLRFALDYPCHSPDEQRWFSVRIAPADIDGARGALVTHVDVSEIQLAKEALAHQALHDALTDLPNRLLIGDRLAQALADAGRRGTQVAVAFLDVDHFKRVNDSLGHPAGDALLTELSRRLRSHLRAGDTLGRYSGDEFVVVLRDLAGPQEAEALAARLCAAVAEPVDLGTATVTVGASVGVAVSSGLESSEELLLAADAAMYDAKRHGRGRVRVFSSELRHGAAERMRTEVGLRRALEREELVLHYQPVVDLGTGRPVAVEALVRWQDPARGLVPPDAFIPVAESSGLVVPLGRWVLERACRDAVGWAQPLDVAVNLSVRQLTQPDVVAQVRRALEVSGLPPRRLLLEVTESAVMEDAEAAGVALDALRRLGVQIAIDDFGTGYSSLLYLRRYPISALKVDRAFVSGLTTSADDAAIVSSVVSLAQAVGATCIAEGVETQEQYAALRAFGCAQAQGYLWSRPVPVEQLAGALAACARTPVPAPRPPSRATQPRPPGEVLARIRALHLQGASLHTIAAALNREGAHQPSGVRWHARAVALHLAEHVAPR